MKPPRRATGSGTSLWRVDVFILPEAEEAAMPLIESVFGRSPICYEDFESRRTVVSVFLEEAGLWTEEARQALRAGLKRIREAGLRTGSGRIRCTRMRKEDWAESWKRHFHPLVVGDRLLIKPTWSRRRPGRGQEEILLDPGLSFGTGHHPTTRFCLEEMIAFGQGHEGRRPPSLLDIGTGSGILAMAGAKLGYAPVEGFDNDPVAVQVARENARLNGVLDRVTFVRRDVARMGTLRGKTHAMVCANLTVDLLLEYRGQIAGRVSEGGRMVLAGILGRQFDRVLEGYEELGWVLRRRQRGGEWTSGAFSFRGNKL